MRAPPPVPLVVAPEGFRAHASGFIQIPFDFQVSHLCDHLEEHLESARRHLEAKRLSRASTPLPLLEKALNLSWRRGRWRRRTPR